MLKTTKIKPVEDWEKEFDEKFLPGQDRVPYYIEYDNAKDFIRSLLSTQKQAYLETGEGLKKDLEMMPDHPGLYKHRMVTNLSPEEFKFREGYNKAIEDYQNKIKSDSLEGEGEE